MSSIFKIFKRTSADAADGSILKTASKNIDTAPPSVIVNTGGYGYNPNSFIGRTSTRLFTGLATIGTAIGVTSLLGNDKKLAEDTGKTIGEATTNVFSGLFKSILPNFDFSNETMIFSFVVILVLMLSSSVLIVLK